jgi:twitching motility protein PilT
MDIRELLRFMVQQSISDIHFKANCSPLIRLNGQLLPAQKDVFSPEMVKDIAYSVMSDPHKKRFEEEGELDFSYALDQVSRFRVNVYRQKGTLALTLRVIPWELKSFADLNLPGRTLEKLCALPSGLILIAGVTGAGKTTTLNTMINYINQNFSYNIITVEDPVEFYHKDSCSSISQREVGNDTRSFNTALKYILRQDPDVIAIGEMRDPEAIAAAVVAAETGHLVVSTIHTMDATHTVQRIVDSYPTAQQAQTRLSIANILRGVVAQKLVSSADGKSRIPCTELMLMTPYIRQLISENKMTEVYTAMGRGQSDGMMTFDQDLLRLCKEGRISRETALAETVHPDNFLSMLQGISVKI